MDFAIPDPDDDFEGHVAALWPVRVKAEGHAPLEPDPAPKNSRRREKARIARGSAPVNPSQPVKDKGVLPLAERIAILTARREALARRDAPRPTVPQEAP